MRKVELNTYVPTWSALSMFYFAPDGNGMYRGDYMNLDRLQHISNMIIASEVKGPALDAMGAYWSRRRKMPSLMK